MLRWPVNVVLRPSELVSVRSAERAQSWWQATSTSTGGSRSAATPLYEGSPTIRPVLVVAVAVVLGAGAVVGYLIVNPEALGDREVAEILSNAVLVLAAVVLLRLWVKILVLRKTRYVIRDDSIHRRYSLLYKQWTREIPVTKLRGHEYAQSRIQTLLGYGTIRLLTGGTNHSLDYLEFEHVDDPEGVRDRVRELVDRTDGA
ncbi:MAG: PH domain-containing protein [Haloferacaceae archaeon]